jgi:hypothetical protein
MEQNYSIEEILVAVKELERKKINKIKIKETNYLKNDNSDIPKNTLKLIEEAEKK